MKARIYISLLLLCALAQISWGVTGHRAIGKIAEKHLTSRTLLTVENLLRGESLADASSWADDIRNNPEFKYTASWHYVNLPGGLNFKQFSATVTTMPGDNVYKMVKRCESDLQNSAVPSGKRATALKFLIHFVGDIHQPMHVSHVKDKGGNNIAVTFFGNEDNLHSLWDSGIIEHEGMTYRKMANAYDNAMPEQIKKWQSDNVMIWLWESYQISTKLYAEAAKNPNLADLYYKDHLEIMQQRIEKSGIRLAGILNSIFDK